MVFYIKICYALTKKQLTEGLRAHSTRAKAATTVLARGVPDLYICQAADWASVHTFTKLYCLDSQVQQEGHFAHLVRQDIFVSVYSTGTPPGEYCIVIYSKLRSLR